MKKYIHLIRLAICADSSLMPQLTKIFQQYPLFKIVVSAPGSQSLIKQLDELPEYPDVLLISSTQATDQQHYLLKQLFSQYPGLKITCILHSTDGMDTLHSLMNYGCHSFLLQQKLNNFSEALSTIKEEDFTHILDRRNVFDNIRHEGTAIRILSMEARLLHLLHTGKNRKIIFARLQPSSEEKFDEMLLTVVEKLNSLKLILETRHIQQSAKDPREKQTTFFTDGHKKVQVKLDDIILIKADKDYVQVQLKDELIVMALSLCTTVDPSFLHV